MVISSPVVESDADADVGVNVNAAWPRCRLERVWAARRGEKIMPNGEVRRNVVSFEESCGGLKAGWSNAVAWKGGCSRVVVIAWIDRRRWAVWTMLILMAVYYLMSISLNNHNITILFLLLLFFFFVSLALWLKRGRDVFYYIIFLQEELRCQ